jgi:neck protein
VATNFFFRQYRVPTEQKLLDDLTIESIKIYGEDVYYIPRNLNNYDSVYVADDQSSYTWAIPIEMYLKNYGGFEGDGNFMSKFGVEIRDQVLWSVSQRRFMDEVGTSAVLVRPREGDLIYFPLNDKCFQVKEVSKFEHFYQLGRLQTWEMTCELFEYSDEVFATGIPEIDKLQVEFSTNILDFTIQTEDGYPLRDQDGYYLLTENYGVDTDAQGMGEMQAESSQFIDFTVTNPFADITDTET